MRNGFTPGVLYFTVQIQIPVSEMKRTIHRFALVAICLGVVACHPSLERENPVGRGFFLFQDDTRPAWNGEGPRPVATTVWYPAAAGSEEQEWRFGPFRAGRVAPNAAFAEHDRRLPLIVMSHGTGGASGQLSWLAEELALNGYLVAAVNHHGNTAFEDSYLPQGFVLWWERARDISVAIDGLLSDARIKERVDTSRIGVAGFSLGGYTALLSAGARTNRAQWLRHCDDNPTDMNCVLPPEAPFTLADLQHMLETDETVKASLLRSDDRYRDERIRAAYVMSPGLTTALDSASLAEISIPVRIVTGDADDQVLLETHVRPVAKAIPGATLDVLPRAGHYVFLAPCGLQGRLFVRDLCRDGGSKRRDMHRRIGQDVLAFFADTFGNGNEQRLAQLRAGGE